MSLIETKNLSKSFLVKEKRPGFGPALRGLIRPTYRAVEAVKDISFSVGQGEILAFIGPNGAGKSTTIKMLTGILHPTSGQISVLGFYPPKDRQKLAFQIATVFGQRSQLSIHLPPMDSFTLLSKIYELDSAEFRERFQFLVECFELKELLQVPVRKLSLGQRMRCEIAASLLHKPKVLFLDEPTIGLDVIAKNRIREVIKFLNEQEKVTVFLTSHDAGDIEALAKRTIVINHGTVVFDDLTEVFKRNYIKSKTVELVVAGGTDNFRFDEGRILEKSDFNLKVELPGSIASIERLFHYAFENFEVQDINIFEPAMEEIIAAIYREKKAA